MSSNSSPAIKRGLKRKESPVNNNNKHQAKKLKLSIDTNMSGFNSVASKVPLSASANKKKTITIKPLKEKPQLPENFEADTWVKLKEAVLAIFSKQKTTSSEEDLYKAVHDLCTHKKEAQLFENLKNECEKHVQFGILPSLLSQSTEPHSYLSLVCATWDDYCDQMLLIRSIFLYLDRTYVMPNQNGIRSLWDLALLFFRTHVLKNQEIEHKVISGLLVMIERERQGDWIDRSMVKELIRMLVALQMYEESFEKLFLNKTNEFYEIEARRSVEEWDVPQYLLHAETRLKQELDRALQYLVVSTKRPLVSTVEKQLIDQHKDTLVKRGFDFLMTHTRMEDLHRMFHLFQQVHGLEKLKEAFQTYITSSANVIVHDAEREKTMVEDCLELKQKMDTIHQQAFASNEQFKYAIKFAFEKALNSKQNKPAELIAKFIDAKLKSNSKALSEDALEKCMDDALVLFRYIDGKDVFEAFYKKDLAKRLLLGKSSSFDAEKTMITKLKTECGSTFTNKLEGMFKDVDVSKDIMTQFKQSNEYQQLYSPTTSTAIELERNAVASQVELNVTVITTGYWPPYPPIACSVPVDISPCLQCFESFYLDKNSGRQLKWVHSLAQCTIKAHFPEATKELQVSLFQSLVLLPFNDADTYTCKELQACTGMEEKELKRTLQSLSLAQVKVLKKSTKTQEVDDADSFSFNKEFSHNLYRIKINQIQAKETEEEKEQTNEKVLVERQYAIDAAVVRIMKARKHLSHHDLMREVLPQLKFQTTGTDIKKRIESLIERDYLERDTTAGQSSTATIYKYLA